MGIHYSLIKKVQEMEKEKKEMEKRKTKEKEKEKEIKECYYIHEEIQQIREKKEEYITEIKELIRLNDLGNLNESIDLKYDQIKKVDEKFKDLLNLKNEMMYGHSNGNVIYKHDFKKEFMPYDSSYNYIHHKERIVSKCKRCHHYTVLMYIK